MLNNILTNPILLGMEKALDGSALRQKAIAANIANVDTPGYKSLEVSFAEQLRNAMQRPGQVIRLRATDSRHIQLSHSSGMREVLVTTDDTQIRNDGNNVDIDREIAKLTSNEIYYDAISRCLNDEFNLLRTVIRGRA
ncbi:MAG: flagellar basal body rod protein FlgB [Bacillota bacterium]